MICVVVGRTRHKRMIAEHQYLVQKGIKLVELRLDCIGRTVDLKRLISDRPGPVIVTCRRKQDGGNWEGSEEDRVTLLRSAIAAGVDYVDLESDIASTIPRFGKTQRIVSMHDFEKTPNNLAELHAEMAAMDADIVKLATMATTPSDNLRMLQLIDSSDVPTVGICMGDLGSPSRILATKYGAPFTFASFGESKSLAPGQFSYRQMMQIYREHKIDADTEVFGVIADPVGHSLSPDIHNAAFEYMNMNRVYLPLRIPAEHLSQFIADCPAMGILGLSVTIPHKQAVLQLCTAPDEEVTGIGAANTLVFDDSSIAAHNTDCSAALDSLEEALGITEKGRDVLNGKSALLLGGGGVAKAIAFGLRHRGADVFVATRSPQKAAPLAESLGCQIIDWNDRHSQSANIIVNCTPIGMHPNVDETPFDKQHLDSSMVVFDAVYNPENTVLIKEAADIGCTVITGVDMFVRQAAIQFRHFTGQEAPMNVMREVMRQRFES